MDLVGSEHTKGSRKTMGERWDVVGNAGEGVGSRCHCYQRKLDYSEVISFKNSCKIAGKRHEDTEIEERSGKVRKA